MVAAQGSPEAAASVLTPRALHVKLHGINGLMANGLLGGGQAVTAAVCREGIIGGVTVAIDVILRHNECISIDANIMIARWTLGRLDSATVVHRASVGATHASFLKLALL